MAIDNIRDIFVPIFPGESDTSAAALYASSLAKACSAHMTLRAINVKAWVPYSPISNIAAGYVAAANEAAHAQVQTIASQTQGNKEIGPSLLDANSYVGSHAQIVQLILQQGRLHDLSVIDRSTRTLDEGSAAINELLFNSGRPVIVVPPTVTSFRTTRVVVAWDGSRQATRAVNDALPLLRTAEHVEIVCVANEKDLTNAVPGAEIAPHLLRHGIKVEVVDLTPMDRSAARAIRDHSELIAADIIVMGAFVHSRMRQLVLGGVTDSMLCNSELPLFMSY